MLRLHSRKANYNSIYDLQTVCRSDLCAALGVISVDRDFYRADWNAENPRNNGMPGLVISRSAAVALGLLFDQIAEVHLVDVREQRLKCRVAFALRGDIGIVCNP